MERRLEEELKAHLIATDEHFRTLAAEHADYDRRIAELESRPYLSDSEQIEETRMKKLKLRAKDQMTEILDRYRAQHVS